MKAKRVMSLLTAAMLTFTLGLTSCDTGEEKPKDTGVGSVASEAGSSEAGSDVSTKGSESGKKGGYIE